MPWLSLENLHTKDRKGKYYKKKKSKKKYVVGREYDSIKAVKISVKIRNFLTWDLIYCTLFVVVKSSASGTIKIKLEKA